MDFQKLIDVTNQQNHFMTHNRMKLTQLWEDHAVVELELGPESRNLFGGVHGGVYFTMADCASGAAARSRGYRHVTLSTSFEYYGTSKNDVLEAVATVRHRGQTICVVSVDVKDGEGKLLAGGTFTMYATGKLED